MICALILAAGRSRRMGTQKLLMPLGGRPVIARLADEILRSPVDQVFVVVGEDGPRIKAALPRRSIQFVTNPVAESEMLDSIRCGLRVMPKPCTAVLVVLGDQPGLTAELAAKVIFAARPDQPDIVVPVANGRRGHPMLFSMCYADEVLHDYDRTGLRGLLEAHPDNVLEVEVSTPDIMEDMDVPDDYRRVAARRQW